METWECKTCGKVNEDKAATCPLCRKGQNPKATGRQSVRLSQGMPGGREIRGAKK